MPNQTYWDSVYERPEYRYSEYDGWLDEYTDLLRSGFVIELGAGDGADTTFLRKNRIRSVSCDFSEEALARLRARLPDAETMKLNLLDDDWPFPDECADAVIADLCLHYFSEEDTRAVARRIMRVLRPGGRLYARVNSIEEYTPSPEDEYLSPNYYLVHGCRKRFFDEKALRAAFADYAYLSLKRAIAKKYGGRDKHMFMLIAAAPAKNKA